MREMCCFIYSNHDTLTGGKLMFIYKNPTGEKACFVYTEKHNNWVDWRDTCYGRGKPLSLFNLLDFWLPPCCWEDLHAPFKLLHSASA